LTLPFAVGLLFGNFDVFFPFLYGTMLLGVLTGERRANVLGGVALVLASLKLHPATMGLWFLVRAVRDRAQSGAWTVVIAAIAVGVGVLAASVTVGGIGLWAEYMNVVRAGTSAVIVDPRNAGIASVLASALGGDDAMARTIHLAVVVAALAITVWAGWRRGDALVAFAWATAASLSVLPVTWYHYGSAMMPIAIAAWLRSDQRVVGRVRATIVASMVIGAVAIAALPLLWVAVGLVILAARWSLPAPAPAGSVALPAPVPAVG
jgi:hypothetical protein